MDKGKLLGMNIDRQLKKKKKKDEMMNESIGTNFTSLAQKAPNNML